MVGIPLPRTRPQPGDAPQLSSSTSYDQLTERLQADFGNLCKIPATPETIPDNNPYFHKYGFTRESFLDTFIEQLIINGFDATFATELATGMYGIESHYGATGNVSGTGCTGKYCGPLQIDMDHYNFWYLKVGKYPPVPDQYLDANAQYLGVALAAWTNYNTLLRVYPNGTWRSKTIEPFDVYMMHQQGQNLGRRAGYQAYINNGPDFKPVSLMSGWKQYGEGTLYTGSSTIRQMISAQEVGFNQGMVRAGSEDCGEETVEFLTGSFIEKPDGVPNFSKAVISLWFSVPQASIDAAAAQWTGVTSVLSDTVFQFNQNLAGIIPLMTWGVNPSITTGDGTTLASPSFIGISCGKQYFQNTSDPTPSLPALVARLQFDYGTNDTNVSIAVPPYVLPEFFEIMYDNGQNTNHWGFGGGTVTPAQVNVSADVLHHVLISFDTSGTCATAESGNPGDLGVFTATSSVKFYVAMDDVNYQYFPTGPDFYVGTGGPNDILSNTVFYIGQPADIPHSATFPGAALPSSGHPIGIPTTSDQVSKAYEIKIAKVQVFLNEVIDPADEVNRRLFIDDDGKPTDPAVAATFFGRDPDIHFNAGTDWQTGTNVGTAGNFTPHGNIIKTKPDPQLGVSA